MDIVGSGGEPLPRCHHVLDGATETVVNVHHGQPGVGSEIALVHTRGQGVVEDLDSVVCGASARVRVVGDDAREAETSEVKVESLVIVFSQELSMHLAHSIDSLGSLDTKVRSGISRRLGTKGSDGAGYKQLQLI